MLLLLIDLFCFAAKVAIPSKEANSQPSSVSSNKKPLQGVRQTPKQTPKQTPSSQKQATSKLPRKVSAQPSSASDSVSVTSSTKDQDLLDDLLDPEADGVSARSESVDLDAVVLSNRHLQQDNPSLNGDIPFDSDETDASKLMVAGSPFDVPCRIMPPDILSETPYLSQHSVGIQVEDDSNLKAIKDLKEKGKNLRELIKQRTELCWQLQNQIDDNNVDFVAASVMILAVVRKVRMLLMKSCCHCTFCSQNYFHGWNFVSSMLSLSLCITKNKGRIYAWAFCLGQGSCSQ